MYSSSEQNKREAAKTYQSFSCLIGFIIINKRKSTTKYYPKTLQIPFKTISEKFNISSPPYWIFHINYRKHKK